MQGGDVTAFLVMNVLRTTTFILLVCWLAPGSLRAQENRRFVVKLKRAFPEAAINNLPLANPQAIAAGPEGHLFVADTGNNRIIRFTPDGRFVDSVGGFGFQQQQFDRPLDISAKNGLDIFVADYNNERIERYDKNLNPISSLRPDPRLPERLQFGFPSSVDISKHGELFIADTENNRILKINTFGTPELSFGDFNWGEGRLEHPVKIEVTPWDMVYVADQQSNRIVVFDYYGNYVTHFGDDKLKAPNGLAWQGRGRLLVADTGHHRVVIFDAKHQPIFSWGHRGDKLGAFNEPVDVCALDKQIYVLEARNARVQVFEISSPTPSPETP